MPVKDDILNAFNFSLKQVIKAINMDFNKRVVSQRKQKSRNYKRYKFDLYLNNPSLSKIKRRQDNNQLNKLKKMFSLTFNKDNFINLLNNTYTLKLLLKRLTSFLFYLKKVFK